MIGGIGGGSAARSVERRGRPKQFAGVKFERMILRVSPELLALAVSRSGLYSVGGYLTGALLLALGETLPPRWQPAVHHRDGHYASGVHVMLPSRVASGVRAAARPSQRQAWLDRTLTPRVFDALDQALTLGGGR